MKIDINNAITIITGLMVIVGAIYRLSQVEANINAKIAKVETNVLTTIDDLGDKITDQIHQNEKRLDIHLTEWNEKKVFVEYRLNGLESLIKHKFERLAGWIRQIAELLGHQFGFQIKDDKF
ncbi:hypothetical protein NIES22_09870 [Calothrix brevissima NIES-22]|nr:hypothetical protein NIES22_09870 [Calothrix brevissima NIES-22]